MTGSEVFKRAVMIMDEQSESGAAEWSDTSDYQKRAVSIINVLSQELYRFSDTYEETDDGSRPLCGTISKLSDYINLDDAIAGSVLPYGLAYHLCLDDNPNTASLCLQRYQELIGRFSRDLPANFDSIEDVYGGITGGTFARW